MRRLVVIAFVGLLASGLTAFFAPRITDRLLTSAPSEAAQPLEDGAPSSTRGAPPAIERSANDDELAEDEDSAEASMLTEKAAQKSPPSQTMLDSAAQLGEVSTKLKATCLAPAVISKLSTSTRAIAKKLRNGDLRSSLKGLGIFINNVSVKANGFAPFVIQAGRIATRLLTGTASEPPLITDPRAAMGSLRITIASSSMSKRARDSLDSHLAKAITALNRGAANEERAELGIVAQTILATAADPKKLLSPAQAASMLLADLSIIVYFDPVPIIVTFRDNLAAGNLDAALAVVHPAIREELRSELSGKPQEQQTLAIKFTTTLTPDSVSGPFTQYLMVRGDTGVNHAIVFGADCDGAWRISDF